MSLNLNDISQQWHVVTKDIAVKFDIPKFISNELHNSPNTIRTPIGCVCGNKVRDEVEEFLNPIKSFYLAISIDVDKGTYEIS
jgi:hypothetical protein